MRKLKKIGYMLLSAVILLTAIPLSVNAANPLGNIPMNPIQLKANQTKNTQFSKNYNAKYFSVVVEEVGILKITYSSEKMKKAVDLSFDYNDGVKSKDTKTIKYDKKKKKAAGTLTSGYIVHPGTYSFVVSTANVVAANTKFTIKTSFKPKNFDDKEPNNTMQNAQSIRLGSKAVNYKMYLSGTEYAQDTIDYFSFKAKSGQKLTVNVNTKSSANLRIIIKRKNGKEEEIINTEAATQHLKKDGSKYTLNYTSSKLEKDEYYVMVWLQDGEKEQIEYNISFAVHKG